MRIWSILLFKKIVWLTDQGIWFILSFIRVVCDVIIKMKQEFILMNLITAELFDEYEIFQILMICDYFNWGDEAFKLQTSFFKDINNNYKFFIINFVVAFNWIMLLLKVNYWMKNSIFIILKENVFRYIIWSISFYHNFVIWIIVMKDYIRNKGFLQSVKCHLTF